MAVIKTCIQKEDDIYIANASTPEYFIMLDIYNLFEKIKTLIQAFPLCPYSDTLEKNPHWSFGSSSWDFYCPPLPHYLSAKIMEYTKDFENAYPSDDLLYFFPETILSLWENLKIVDWNYQHSVPNPYSLLPCRADAEITYMTNNLLYHSQCLRA